MPGTRRNGLAAISGDSYRNIEDMAEVLENRMQKSYSIVIESDTALMSPSPHIDQGDVYVAFNGYLEDREGIPEEAVAEIYRERGKEFIEHLNGSFRLILYDVGKDTLYVSADKIGRKVIYYTENAEDFVCSSHLKPLLRHPQVEAELDRQGLADFLQSWSVSLAGGRRLLKGVRRLPPSHVAVYSGGELRMEKFWEIYNSWRDVSDSTAVEQMERLLVEGVENLVDRVDGPLNVFLSGGLDSSVLTSVLSENTDRKIRSYTWGWRDEHFTDAVEMSEKLGTEQHSLRLDHRLPSREEIRFYEEPHNALARYPFRELFQDYGLENYWTGLNSQATFPVCLRNVRKLDWMRWSRPLLMRMDTGKLERLLEKVDYRLAKGLSVLGSENLSAGASEDWGLRKAHAKRLLSDELDSDTRDIDTRLDERWELHPGSFQENYSYLQLRARDTARYAYYSQDMEHIDPFGYTPLLEYSYSLPMRQKKNRRILRRIARGRVSDSIITKGASGWEFVSEQFRKMIESDRQIYRETVESFLERGYLDEEPAREFLLRDSFEDLSLGPVNQMLAVYMLEQWMQVFLDREEPWRPVG